MGEEKINKQVTHKEWKSEWIVKTLHLNIQVVQGKETDWLFFRDRKAREIEDSMCNWIDTFCLWISVLEHIHSGEKRDKVKEVRDKITRERERERREDRMKKDVNRRLAKQEKRRKEEKKWDDWERDEIRWG